MDEGALRKWMGLELGKVNQGMVTQPASVARLLADPAASGTTRAGEPFAYDRAAVARLAARVPGHLHARLRLPVTVYEPGDMPGDGYVEDAAAVEALSAMGAATTTPRAGRLWMASVLWRRLAAEFPTCFQTVHL